MKFKKFYIVLLTLIIIYYTFLFYEINFCTINSHLMATMILFIPIGLIIITYVLYKKQELSNVLSIVITIILIILFCVLNIFVFAFIGMEEGVAYENNPYRYKHIYEITGYKDYTYQFPEELPQKVLSDIDVKFFYSPQFLQGGFNLELMLPMEVEEIDEYIKKYKDNVKEIIKVGEENIGQLGGYGISKPRYIFDDYIQWDNFLKGSEIYLLDNKPYKIDDWNHGYVVYMAKNESLKQLLLGCGSAVLAGDAIGTIGIALAFGLSIVAIAYSVGRVSGGHVNPAVSLAMLINKKMDLKDFCGYVVSQILGAFVASGILKLIVNMTNLGYVGLGANGYGELSAVGLTLSGALIIEIIATFIFILTILGVTHNEKYSSVAGLVIGLVLALIHIVVIPLTGTSVNPARSLAPAVLVGETALSQVWLFIVAPLVGAAIAAVVWNFIAKDGSEI